MNDVVNHDVYFTQCYEYMNTLSISSYLKCTTAIRLIAYGALGDFVDDYCCLSASIANECMNRWVRVIRETYEENTYDNLHETIS